MVYLQSVVVFLASHTYYVDSGMTATVTAYNDDDLTLHHRFFIHSNSIVSQSAPLIYTTKGAWLICSYPGCPDLPHSSLLMMFKANHASPSIKDSEYNFATYSLIYNYVIYNKPGLPHSSLLMMFKTTHSSPSYKDFLHIRITINFPNRKTH